MTRHNASTISGAVNLVVNCFQKLLSSWHDTTWRQWKQRAKRLWIAFKNYYLRDTTQHFTNALPTPTCCELLSKIIIFVTRHNNINLRSNTAHVVNCFQKLLSSWHDTTGMKLNTRCLGLWIAFKNYYLRDTTQLPRCFKLCITRCELLSKIIIFVTRHNVYTIIANPEVVVNCFQKLLSSWHDTTFTRSSLTRKLVVNCFQKLLSSWHDTTF